ncbi:MAG: pilus assembly protein [Chloroflexi bacterium]|nr:pilus assembly protein [Chloroflexota bacterium]
MLNKLLLNKLLLNKLLLNKLLGTRHAFNLSRLRLYPASHELSCRRIDQQRGDTLIEFMLVLPIVLMLVIGGFAIWRVINVKESLRSATYNAARYLSLQGIIDEQLINNPDNWRAAATYLVMQDLSQNTFVDRGALLHTLSIRVERPCPQPGHCETAFLPSCPGEEATNPNIARERMGTAMFRVQSAVSIPWNTYIPFVGGGRITLVENSISYLECPPLTH